MAKKGESTWLANDELLKSMWNGGKQSAEIVAAINAAGGNGGRMVNSAMIMGRIDRLRKMGVHFIPAKEKGGASLKSVKDVRPAAPTRSDTVIFAPRETSESVLALEAKFNRIPESRPVTIWAARERHCRWPLGNPLNPDEFRFCGAEPSGSSCYCAAHRKMSKPIRAQPGEAKPRTRVVQTRYGTFITKTAA